MPVVSLKNIVDPALKQRYGVPAINILNDLTLEGVLLAAVAGAVAADRADVGEDGPVDRQPGAVRDVDVDDGRHRGARSRCTWTTAPTAP